MRRPFLWAWAAFFLVSGATWLVSMIWMQGALDFAPQYAPHVVAALLSGATFARVLDRRTHAIAYAAGATLVWVGVQLVAFLLHDTAAPWSAPVTGASHYAVLAVLAVPVAAATASLRLAGRPDHRLLWLWLSALMMLGAIIASLTVISKDRSLPALGVIAILVAPLVTGAMTQVLAPYRAIWTCGGGALIFVLIMLDQGFRDRESGDFVGALLGMGMFVLLGALGARIGWRVFRNKDPRKRAVANLPTATAT
jgi:hypothetical protein